MRSANAKSAKAVRAKRAVPKAAREERWLAVPRAAKRRGAAHVAIDVEEIAPDILPLLLRLVGALRLLLLELRDLLLQRFDLGVH